MKRRLDESHIVGGTAQLDHDYADMAHRRLAAAHPDLAQRLASALSRLGHECRAAPPDADVAAAPTKTTSTVYDHTSMPSVASHLPSLHPRMYDAPPVEMELVLLSGGQYFGVDRVNVSDYSARRPLVMGRASIRADVNLVPYVREFDRISHEHMSAYYSPAERCYFVRRLGKNPIAVSGHVLDDAHPTMMITPERHAIHTIKTAGCCAPAIVAIAGMARFCSEYCLIQWHLAQHAPRTPGSRTQVLPIRVLRVVDGDSIVDTHNMSYRLIGIDAPELDQPGGREARGALSAMIARHPHVGVIVHGKDKYRRVLAEVITSPSPRFDTELAWLNDAMAAQGWAWSYARTPGPIKESTRRVDFLALEANARAHRRGIWNMRSVAHVLPQEHRRAKRARPPVVTQ